MSQERRSLDRLPPEIISQIITHAPSVKFLRELSLTNRALHDVVETDGWAAFVTNRFPSMATPPYWRDAAHGLTTLSRNLDRKAFIAEDVGPNLSSGARLLSLPDGNISQKWNRSSGQTMGYQPVIDSHEVWGSDGWASRREVLAWGAGAEAVIKIHRRRDGVEAPATWVAYRDPQCRDGLHDITALRILNHTGSASDTGFTVNLMIGRASGGIQKVELNARNSKIARKYDCGNANVQCADVNGASDPLLAACLGDSTIGLFKVNGPEQAAQCLSEATCGSAEEKGSRSWSSRFISNNRLAIGRGISKRIVYVYDVQPDGISTEPLRAFSSELSDQGARNTSAYPIVSVPKSTQSNDGDGDLLFSGGYDGIIRLVNRVMKLGKR